MLLDMLIAAKANYFIGLGLSNPSQLVYYFGDFTEENYTLFGENRLKQFNTHLYQTISVQTAKKFIEKFNLYLVDQRGFDLSDNTNGKDIRSLFFRFFSTKEFKGLYESIAKELAKEFDISEDEVLVQANPTPRVFRPNDHGTNWHNDYWYGHGKHSRTVWVPIKGVVPKT